MTVLRLHRTAHRGFNVYNKSCIKSYSSLQTSK